MTRSLIGIAFILLACKHLKNETQVPSVSPIDSVQKIKPGRDIVKASTNLYAEHKRSLDSLFIARKNLVSFNEQNYFTSLLIGNLFEKENKDAVLMYKINDTISYMCVLRKIGNKWDTLLSEKIFPVHNELNEELINVSDFNGDKIPDLKVVKHFWGVHTGEFSDLWLYRKNHFFRINGFENIVSAEYDEKSKLIYSYQSRGCADNNMYLGVFKIVNNKVQTVKEMYCDCCSETSNNGTISFTDKKSFQVPFDKVYQYVPAYFRDAVKEKCKTKQ